MENEDFEDEVLPELEVADKSCPLFLYLIKCMMSALILKPELDDITSDVLTDMAEMGAMDPMPIDTMTNLCVGYVNLMKDKTTHKEVFYRVLAFFFFKVCMDRGALL